MSDYISRQSAIDALYHHFPHMTREECATILHEVGDVEPEIIRCRDCKHSEHWYGDKARCFLWVEDGIDVFNDGFCSYAERKEE